VVTIAGAEQPAAESPVFSRFDHVLVDEYQETNHVQYELLRLLSDGHRKLVVLSDADQRIRRSAAPTCTPSARPRR
jgi:superfamily I DNA/RNA helicase